jgi:hypothetical protein
MKQTHPPALAAWMLDHLTPGRQNLALAGDLHEEFCNGRSAVWYWRQAVSAIAIGLLLKCRYLLSAVIFAAVWTAPLPAAWFYMLRHTEGTRLFAWVIQLDWPYSALGDMALAEGPQLLLVWAGLVVFLGLNFLKTRNANVARLPYGLLTTIPTLIAANIALQLLFLGNFSHATTAVYLRFSLDPMFFLTRLPLFLGLLLSIWVAEPSSRKAGSRAIA